MTAKDIEYLMTVVGPLNVLTDADEVSPFNVDFTRKYSGQCKVVVTPKSTEEISAVLKYCNEHNLPVVPQGGNTGLVGGSVPFKDEIVMSTKRMNDIYSFDPIQGTVRC